MPKRESLLANPCARRATLAAVVLAALLGGAGAMHAAEGKASEPPSRVAKVEETKVTIDNFTFSPAAVTVPVGATVTWTNDDDMVHTVTEAHRQFSSNELETGDTYTHTFTTPGTYTYYCALHPKMTATVIVK
jgi:plastocyanin